MRASLTSLAGFVVGLCLLAFASGSYASEPVAFERQTALIMVDARDCGWCRKWEREVMASYVNSPEGKAAPLVKRDRRHADLGRFRGLAYTPTFILLVEGTEVGRIVGYSGPDFFWGEFDRLWRSVPSADPGRRAAAPAPLRLASR